MAGTSKIINKKMFYLIVIMTLIAGWSLSHADIFKYVDENGVAHFTNTPDTDYPNYKKIISEDKPRVQKQRSRGSSISSEYHQIVENKSAKYNVEPSLVKAVIKAESNWDSHAVSQKGAMGLMQLMPSTASDMAVSNPFNAEENIDGGTRYLRFLIDRFDGDVSLAIAAYNAGPGTIDKFGGIPPIPETKNYVKQVLSMYNGNINSKGTQDIIYKVVYNDGTVLFTNTPLLYEIQKISKF